MSLHHSSFKIQERTALIYGSVDTISRAIANRLSDLGASVVIAHPMAHKLKVFTGSLNDRREIHPEYGQLTTIEQPITNENHAHEVISSTAQSFGGLDILIDLSAIGDTSTGSLKGSKILAKKAFTFLESRSRSRMVYLFNSPSIYGDKSPTDIPDFYNSLIKEKTIQGITLNSLSLGVTEDYLRKHFPEINNIDEALQCVLKKRPKQSLIDPNEIANLVAFLCSPLSSIVNGQIIQADGGASCLISTGSHKGSK